MPSFFESLSRIINGKPVFNPADAKVSAKGGESSMQNNGKTIKKAHITDVECFDGGSGMECWVTIQNGEDENLDLNQLEFLGKSTDLQTILSPREQRKFMIYQGPHIQQTTNNVCTLEYIDTAGDYFVASHYIQFRQDPNGKYEIDRINLNQIWDK